MHFFILKSDRRKRAGRFLFAPLCNALLLLSILKPGLCDHVAVLLPEYRSADGVENQLGALANESTFGRQLIQRDSIHEEFAVPGRLPLHHQASSPPPPPRQPLQNQQQEQRRQRKRKRQSGSGANSAQRQKGHSGDGDHVNRESGRRG